MLKISSSFFAVGLLLAPAALYAQAPPSQAQQPGSALQPGQVPQPAATQPQAGKTDVMVTASSLINSRVIDSQNREIGTLSNLMVDPKTGRILRADIELAKGAGWFGPEQRMSVSWEQLAVKQQDGKIVVALQQDVLDRVQKESKERGAKTGANDRGAEAKSSGRQ